MINVVLTLFCVVFLFSVNSVYSTTVDNDNEEITNFNNEDVQSFDAQTPQCGMRVEHDIKLNSDLDCSSDGLIVEEQKDLIIDLNGHSIIGPGTMSQKTGIRIDDSENIQINGSGIIKNFQGGITTNSDNQISISSTNLQNNEIGVFFIQSKNSILQNSFFKFNDVGTALHSNFNIEIVNNTLESDHLAGITLVGTSESKISGNNVKGSVNGIFLDGDSNNNIVDRNNAFGNRGVDLNNGNGISTETNENVFTDNKCNTSVPTGLCISK